VNAEAPVLPCSGCGASLAVDPALLEARCSGCRAVTRIPDALRERARAYRRSLGAERGRVEQARRSTKDSFAKLGKYFGPPFALILVAHVVATLVVGREYRDYEEYGFYGAMGLLGAAFFMWIAFAIRAEIRGDEAPAGAQSAAPVPMFEGSAPGTCSTCGGQVTFVVEQASARCPYCGATVFPTPAAQQALFALVAERADLEVGRASRARARDLASTFEGGALEGAMTSVRWVSWLIVPVLFVGIGTALALHDGLPDPMALDDQTIAGLILAGAGVFLTAAILGITWLVRRLSRVNAIRRTLRAVGAPAGTHVVAGVRPLLDWLDAHWAASVPDEVMTVVRSDSGDKIRRFSVATVFAGRPAILVVAHAPQFRRTDLFLALHRRRDPQAGHSTRAAAEVRAAGYAVLVSNGGAHFIVLDSDPRAFAPETVTWLLQRAAQVAEA
jgi:DNA-directed RNA polymerase subunit RPC12/RpoP